MKIYKTITRCFLVMTGCLFYTSSSFGFYGLMDTGELMNKGYHRVLGQLQFLTSRSDQGANLSGRFSTGLNGESDLQGEFGVGEVDLYVAGFWKWIPFPDTSRQPALGLRSGFTFANFNGTSVYGIHVTPLISKKLKTLSAGLFTPYFGLPVGFQNSSPRSFVSLKTVFGLDWVYPKWKRTHFLMEGGININDDYNHFSIGASIDF